MSTHRFTIDVEVSGDKAETAQTEWPDRAPGDYALAALQSVSLRDAANLDGFADLTWEAYITSVQEE